MLSHCRLPEETPTVSAGNTAATRSPSSNISSNVASKNSSTRRHCATLSLKSCLTFSHGTLDKNQFQKLETHQIRGRIQSNQCNWKKYSRRVSSTATSASVSCPSRQSRALGLRTSSTWTGQRATAEVTFPKQLQVFVHRIPSSQPWSSTLEQSWSTVSTQTTGSILAHEGRGNSPHETPATDVTTVRRSAWNFELAQQSRTKHNVASNSGFKLFIRGLNVYSLGQH